MHRIHTKHCGGFDGAQAFIREALAFVFMESGARPSVPAANTLLPP